MDEDEIDSWYEEQKDNALEDYMKNIENTKNHEESQRIYEAKLSKIIEKYNRLMSQKLKINNHANQGKLARFFSESVKKISFKPKR